MSVIFKEQLYDSDISRLQLMLRTGQVSLAELFDHHASRISKLNSAVNALRFTDIEGARMLIGVRQSELSSGAMCGRLHGMLFSLKDSFHLSGMPRSDGSVCGGNSISTQTSSLVQKLLNEGAVCVGKGNMAEYGKSYYSENPLFGRTNNPFNLEHSPGGSGGGDACAVALDFAQFGLGADSGGSIRVPANFCGLFGLYPTRGVLTDSGTDAFAHTLVNLFRNAGPLAKSLNDLELLFHILRGFDSRDHNSVELPLTKRFESLPKNKKFAFYSSLNGVQCDSEISGTLLKAVKRLEECGFQAIEFTPAACAAAYEIFIVLAGQAALLLEDQLANEAGKPRDPSKEGPAMKTLRQRIKNELPELTVSSLLRAWHRVDALRNMMASTFQEFAFILTPVAAGLAPKHGTSTYSVNSQQLESQQHFQFASLVNLLGLPAIAFPTGISSNGLPLGLQLIGPRFSEQSLIETLRSSGYEKRPPELIKALHAS